MQETVVLEPRQLPAPWRLRIGRQPIPLGDRITIEI